METLYVWSLQDFYGRYQHYTVLHHRLGSENPTSQKKSGVGYFYSGFWVLATISANLMGASLLWILAID